MKTFQEIEKEQDKLRKAIQADIEKQKQREALYERVDARNKRDYGYRAVYGPRY